MERRRANTASKKPVGSNLFITFVPFLKKLFIHGTPTEYQQAVYDRQRHPAFAVIFVVVIFVYMSMRLQQRKEGERNFIETYTITLTKGFAGDSTSIFINDSLLVNRTIAEEPFTIEVKRFAEQSALMIVNNATEKLSLFELSEKGGEYRFEKEGEEVKQLAQE